jgi:hypothetical protein
MKGDERFFAAPVTRCRVRWQVRLFDGLVLVAVLGGALAVIRWLGEMMARWEGGPWGIDI